MRGYWGRVGLGIGCGLVWLAAGCLPEVSAQAAGAARRAYNPYTDPYVNPFLNPYAVPRPMSRADVAWSILGAQQARGGIGSGQLSGVRAAQELPISQRYDRRDVSSQAPSMMPGGGASGYFFRGLNSQNGRSYFNQTGRRYDRHGRYYQDNAR